MSTNASQHLQYIEINPNFSPEKTIIWLHGLGADGHDFVPIVQALSLPKNLCFRYIFPHAPIMPVTINNGVHMRAWYDIVELALDSRVDEQTMLASIKHIQYLIEKEQATGIKTENIFLAGFSQGAVIALLTALQYPSNLAGVIALSGYLPNTSFITNTNNAKAPIFMAHGREDPIVPYALGQMAYQVLERHGYDITFHGYAMGHAVCPAEIDDLRAWLLQQSSVNKT